MNDDVVRTLRRAAVFVRDPDRVVRNVVNWAEGPDGSAGYVRLDSVPWRACLAGWIKACAPDVPTWRQATREVALQSGVLISTPTVRLTQLLHTQGPEYCADLLVATADRLEADGLLSDAWTLAENMEVLPA